MLSYFLGDENADILAKEALSDTATLLIEGQI